MAKNEFNSENYLYHYTKFCSAIKILCSNTLLFGRLKDMNDINELYRPLYFSKDTDKECSKLVNSHQQLSFTIDKDGIKGFDIPAMWGHYAENGKGMCLIFDKEKLLKVLPEGCKPNIIAYTDDFDNSIICDDTILKRKSFNDDEYDELFFKKTKDWEYEQEFRVLIKSDSDDRVKLNFRDALYGVIMHRSETVENFESIFQSGEFEFIQNKCKNVLEYSFFLDQRNLRDKEGKSICSNFDIKDYSLDV